MQYEDWEDAKRGIISRRRFVRLHVLADARGKRPVIDPRRDHTLKGYNPRAEMLRWRQENPEELERTYHRRSLVESVLSSLKARFGAVVAAKPLPLQRLQLILRSVCYNLLP